MARRSSAINVIAAHVADKLQLQEPYVAHDIVVAVHCDIPFFACDRRFFNAAHGSYDHVHMV